MQVSFVPREVISQKINEAKIQEYEATEELSFDKRREKEVKRLEKAAENIKKKSLRLIDLIAGNGALDPEQLIYYGADPSMFYNIDQYGRYGTNKKAPIGKKLKIVWSVKNPKQTISDLTERYNEEMGLFDMGARAGGSSDRTMGDNEMAEM